MRAPDFWQTGGVAAALLSPLGALYGASVAFKARNAKPFDPGLPVICVGNLTAGGSGKTPVAIAIAEMLRARGHRAFFPHPRLWRQRARTRAGVARPQRRGDGR